MPVESGPSVSEQTGSATQPASTFDILETRPCPWPCAITRYGDDGIFRRGGGPRSGTPRPGTLRGSLEAAGRPSPGRGSIAHHVVAANARVAQTARNVLERAGVAINDARNGVWITKPGAHPEAYYRTVNQRLLSAEQRGGGPEVLKELWRLRRDIATGRLKT